ncbi:MAG: histidine phosphatase family protein [Planctomycetes bacterium]|nr:histidine phosphatase family protein [Planctomycetota bacterium]
MKRQWLGLLALLALSFFAGAVFEAQMRPARAAICVKGDLSGDGNADITDAVYLLTHLFLGGPPPVDCQPPAPPVSAVFIVRHAEKDAGADPGLTPEGQARAERLATVLAKIPIDLMVASNLKRTQETIQPLATAKSLSIEQISDTDTDAVVARLDQLSAGSIAVVAGHSYNIEPMLQKLGIQDTTAVDLSVYDNLFLVLRPAGQVPQMLNLIY